MLKLHRQLSDCLQFLQNSAFEVFLLVIFNNVILTKNASNMPLLVLKITKKHFEKVNK